MPKLSGLIPILAQVLAIPEQSVAMFARHLRESRLISTGGRGPGGAEMSARDCANLLIALLGGSYAKDAAKTVRNYRRITASPEWPAWDLDHLDLPELKKLPLEHQFGRALEALILAAKKGTLEAALQAGGAHFDRARIFVPVNLFVRLTTPHAHGQIDFRANEWREGIRYAESLTHPALLNREELKKWSDNVDKRMKASGEFGDLFQSRHVTARTILALGAFLRT